jgi:tryptophan synthase alpha chain
VIQEASFKALQKKTYLPGILKMVKKLRRKASLPIALMTYYNPIFCFGEKRFVDAAVASGVDGLIIPDLPPEEAKFFLRYAKERGLANICFLAPTSSLERVKFISKASQGFIYYVCLTGITGARKNLPADIKENIARIKRYTSQPVCVGFGISTAGQVRAVKRICDGAIVGSAIVKKIKENIKHKNLVKRVGSFVGKLNV